MSQPRSNFKRFSSFFSPTAPFEAYIDCLNGVQKQVDEIEIYIKEHDRFINPKDRIAFNTIKEDLVRRQVQLPKLGKWANIFVSRAAKKEAEKLQELLQGNHDNMRQNVEHTQRVLKDQKSEETASEEKASEGKANEAKTSEIAVPSQHSQLQNRLQGIQSALTTGFEVMTTETVTMVDPEGTEYKVIVKLERVNGGAFGIIRVGTSNALGELAIKSPTKERPSEDGTKRFLREAEIWAKMSHDHILPYYGKCTFDNTIHLVSPYIRDADVYKFLARNRNVSRAKLLRDVASALEYMHSQTVPVIHGDVKASNMLIGQPSHIYLCDFGLTKLSNVATTRATRGLGTICWLSPERLSSDTGSHRTAEDDVYAFGITIAEFLREGHPYGFGDGDESDLGDFTVGVVVKNRRPSKGTGPLWAIAERCWTTKAADRPTMAQVVRELEAQVAEEARLSTVY